MKTEKKYLMYGIALIILTLVGVSLSYFVTEIVGSSKSVSVSTGDLRIVFTDTDGSITGNDIEPGWSSTKTFSVENKTNSSYKYNIVIEDLVNTFSTTGYLVYKITSADGGYNMTDYVDVPKSNAAKDTVLAYSISIPSKTTHNYTIEIKYLNDEENSQNIDMNSTLSGNIYITKGGYDLLAAMLRDNPNISTRSDFSVTNTNNTTGTLFTTNQTEDDSVVYYYSGNTTNNWIKFGKETKGSCTYNDETVTFIIDKNMGNSISDSLSEEQCTNTNVCILAIGENIVPMTGYESLDECNTSVTAYFSELGVSSLEDAGITLTYSGDKAIFSSEVNDIYWRIIRTNEDGSVRLLYAGMSPDTTEGYIGKSVFNSIYTESRYVGYMYGGNTSLEDNRTNTTSSKIKTYIDNWYQKNLLTYYDKYISKSAIYCNDRSIGSGTWVNKGDFRYGASVRLISSKNPTYKCGSDGSGGLFESTQAIEDKFSASTTGGGNGQLRYGIALMTADEIVFAGGKYTTSLSSPYAYYYTNSEGNSSVGTKEWWLMTPAYTDSNVGYVNYRVENYSDKGGLRNISVNSEFVVRPVLSLKFDVRVDGSGTAENPYHVIYD